MQIHIEVVVDAAARTVTFEGRRSSLAIHPDKVTVPFAILKGTMAAILGMEAQGEGAVGGVAKPSAKPVVPASVKAPD